VVARAETEPERRLSDERFRRLIEQAPVAIETYNRCGVRIQANPAWAQLWGVKDLSQVLGHFSCCEDPQVHQRGYDRYIRRALNGEVVTLREAPYDPAESNQPGRKRWTSTHLFPLRDAAGEVSNFVVMHEDVTDQYETASQLEVFQRLADDSSQRCGWMSLDGEELFRELRRVRSDVKVILTSGYNEQEATGRFDGKGLAGFIAKPFDLGTFQRKLRLALGDS
jgi:PAS domain S-box-containing protein